MTEVVGFISWKRERVFWGFQYIHVCSGSPAELIRFHPPPLWIFICLFVCFADGYVTTSLYNDLLEMSVDDILWHVYNNAHINTHIHTNILTYIHTPTHLHKVLRRIYYSCRLLICSYHKSYQQYFDSLLNYQKLEKFIATKRRK